MYQPLISAFLSTTLNSAGAKRCHLTVGTSGEDVERAAVQIGPGSVRTRSLNRSHSVAVQISVLA